MSIKFEFRWNCSQSPIKCVSALYSGEQPQGQFMGLEVREYNTDNGSASKWEAVPMVWNGKPDDL